MGPPVRLAHFLEVLQYPGRPGLRPTPVPVAIIRFWVLVHPDGFPGAAWRAGRLAVLRHFQTAGCESQVAHGAICPGCADRHRPALDGRPRSQWRSHSTRNRLPSPPTLERFFRIYHPDPLPPTAVNINEVCEPDYPIQPTLLVVNYYVSSLNFELTSDDFTKRLTVPAGETARIRIPTGEYSFTAIYPDDALPATGQVALKLGCRTELTFWVEAQ